MLGRRAADNLIIAREMVHRLRTQKGRTGSMVLKIDLEKAYDRLEWGFIREVLIFF
jgi:hypothetical protein